MARQLRIVRARTETPGEFRAADGIPSPARDNISEAINSPSMVSKRIHDQDLALQKQGTTTTTRPTDAPAPPSMTDYLKKGQQ